MTLAGRKEKVLNGEEVMDLWVQMGSLGRVSRFFQSKGVVNPCNGKPFTENAFWRAASRFMVYNPEAAREKYAKDGGIYSDKEWELMVLKRAMQVFRANRSGFLLWVTQLEWPKKYEYLYLETYGVNPDEDYDVFTQLERRVPKGAARKSRNNSLVS